MRLRHLKWNRKKLRNLRVNMKKLSRRIIDSVIQKYGKNVLCNRIGHSKSVKIEKVFKGLLLSDESLVCFVISLIEAVISSILVETI